MENRQVSLSHLFGSVVNSMQENQQYLNSLDDRDGDAGDNSLHNFQIASQAAQIAEQRGMDAEGQLRLAAQALRQQGQGQMAQLYASGFDNSAGQYRGQAGLTMSDFGSLIQAMSGGMSQAGARGQGQGSPLDALLPAAMGYMAAKQRGADDQSAILSALAGAAGQSGMLGGAQQGMSPGGGMGNVLGALLGGLMGGAGGGMPQSRPAPRQSGDPLADMLGGLLGGGMGQGGGMSQGRNMPQQGGSPLGDILGGLLGGGAGQGGGMPQGRNAPQQGGDPLSDILGGLMGGMGGAPQRPMSPDEGTVLRDTSDAGDQGSVFSNLSRGMPSGGRQGLSGGGMPDPGAAASTTFLEGMLRGFMGGGSASSGSDESIGSAPPGGGGHRRR